MGGGMEIAYQPIRFPRYSSALILFFLVLIVSKGIANERKDTLVYRPYRDTVKLVKAQVYDLDNSTSLVFYKPGTLRFVRNVPSDLASFCKISFSRKNLPTLGAILGGTALLIAFDQPILDATQQFGRYLNIDPERKSKTVLALRMGGFRVPLLDIPQNLNSSIYFIGEGWPSIFIAGSLYGYGAIAKDYRALQTSSQLAEMFLTLGITTQFIKRITGRESPFQATQRGGRWRPFPNPAYYQKHVSNFDAFPSGHLATVMATVTILSGNYPENRYIKPVGYTIMGLVGFAMINNGVHWISDYPLAIAIGYTYGRIAVSRGHMVLPKKLSGLAKSSTITPTLIGQDGFGLSYRYTF